MEVLKLSLCTIPILLKQVRGNLLVWLFLLAALPTLWWRNFLSRFSAMNFGRENMRHKSGFIYYIYQPLTTASLGVIAFYIINLKLLGTLNLHKDIINAYNIQYNLGTRMSIGVLLGIIGVSLRYHGGSLGQKYAPFSIGVSSVLLHFKILFFKEKLNRLIRPTFEIETSRDQLQMLSEFQKKKVKGV